MKPIEVILSALFLAIQFSAAVYLGEIISYAGLVPALLYLVLTAAVYMLLLLSEKRDEALAKWFLSMPLCNAVMLYFWETKYAVRALNWAYPGYGMQSAGGKFTASGLLLVQAALCGSGVIAAVSRPQKPDQKATAIRLCIGGGCTLAVIAVVLLLEMQFPSYEQIVS